MTDIALVQQLERTLARVWPAVETEEHGPWSLRFAHGYSARANSANALAAAAPVTPELLLLMDDFYRQHGLPPRLRQTPLVAEPAEELLLQHGYAVQDVALTMTAPLQAFRGLGIPAALTLAPVVSAAWIAGVTALNTEASKRNPAALAAIACRIRPPAAFAEITADGETLGYGLAALHGGWAELGSIIIAPEARGRGFGRNLVAALLAWAAAEGAGHAFLQVDVENNAAITLYRTLGFAECYRYATWRKAV